jgi:hypothetical protein
MGKAKRKSDQPAPDSVTPLLAPIQALQSLLSRFHERGVIIGGVAASLLGTPRYTVDLSLGILPFEVEMVERSRVVDLGPITLRLPMPEDLIIMKAVAHRPKDLEDIRTIAASHPVLDRERIRFWVEQFGEALDLPDLWKMISQLL